MAEKDLTEKSLLKNKAVFADIVNVLLYNGIRKVKEAELFEIDSKQIYKDEKMHFRERDNIMVWKRHGKIIGYFGVENQTKIDESMPARIMLYDGIFLVKQFESSPKGEHCPIKTLVLYFGDEKKWEKPLSVMDSLDCDEFSGPIYEDYNISVFNIAFLSREICEKFESDFYVVPDFFLQIRENGEYNGNSKKLKFPRETLYLLYLLSGDERFIDAMNEIETGRIENMCQALDIIENRGIKKGIEQGIVQGKAEGITEGLINAATNMLNADFRVNVIAKMTGLPEETILKLKKTE